METGVADSEPRAVSVVVHAAAAERDWAEAVVDSAAEAVDPVAVVAVDEAAADSVAEVAVD